MPAKNDFTKCKKSSINFNLKKKRLGIVMLLNKTTFSFKSQEKDWDTFKTLVISVC